MKYHSKHFVVAVFCSILATGTFLAGQASTSISGRPLVISEFHHDVSPALRDLAPSKIAQTSSVAPVTTTNGLNFDGITAGINNGGNNPDVNGAVGATQYLQWQNANGGQFAVYDKTTGNLTYGPFSSGKLWQGFAGPCGGATSIQNVVNYDKAAGRWVMVRHVYVKTPPNYICFAVSQTSDASGKWNRYGYALSNDLLDYPKLGVWPDAYYLSVNLLNPAPPHRVISPMVCAFDRLGMIAGTAANPVCFTPTTTFKTLLPSDLDGATPPPTGSPNYFVNLDTNSVDIWQFHVDFTTTSNSTFTGPTNVAVPPFQQACYHQAGTCIPQLASPPPPPYPSPLAAWSDRLMNRLAYRNFGAYESILATHAVISVATTSSSAIAWYEIRTPGTTPKVYQAETWQPDNTSRWMASIAQDQFGDIAIGYSESSTTQFPSIAYTGRVPTDPLNTLEPETVIMQGLGNQVYNSGWGSYTSLTVDPIDDCTFWYTNQYYTEQKSKIWSTRIASFKFPSCP